MMNARLYLARHGATDMNSTSGQQERFRAWADIPLNEQGIQDAHTAGAYLADKGIKHIFASDLDRTMHTAQIIGQYTGAQVTPVHGLRPWNLGEFTGKPVEPNEKTVQNFQDNPDKPIPGGESYNEFNQRFHTTFQHLAGVSHQMQAPIALVTHTRDINSLKGMVQGKKTIPIHSMTPPGGIVRADIRNGKISLTDEDPVEGKQTEIKSFQE